tara:strand:- start:436 stop:585 length:150 start_codon:yes stop_codon:yes gene_type:complete
MKIENKILEALNDRKEDLKNLDRSEDAIIKLSENLTSIIIIQDIILKTK